jgi:hypothetical protein
MTRDALVYDSTVAYGTRVKKSTHESCAMILTKGQLFDDLGLVAPQAAVWFDDGSQHICKDEHDARVVVESRYALEAP